MARNDGGPAFPHDVGTATGGFNESDPGMSLRDYFAGQTLMAVHANFTANHWSKEKAATFSYEMADAMLKARESR